jgi:tRNA A37 threonylcarbamoyladenosine synthetase subunit TsaC/SUA5/YrdC
VSTTPAGVSPNWIELLDHLESDGLVAFPTETVWGLAARAESNLAVERLREFRADLESSRFR